MSGEPAQLNTTPSFQYDSLIGDRALFDVAKRRLEVTPPTSLL